MIDETMISEMLEETRRRQRTTDFTLFRERIEEMMRLNISLPVILDWLKKSGKDTTLPALRRFVVRAFGEDCYDNYVARNGWKKSKKKKIEEESKNSYSSNLSTINSGNNVNEINKSGVIEKGDNPLRALSGSLQRGDYNPIPEAKPEFDN